jgi:hypothetical protein
MNTAGQAPIDKRAEIGLVGLGVMGSAMDIGSSTPGIR